jgi:3D (Asp-Asp-Asp) domain-containing protein
MKLRRKRNHGALLCLSGVLAGCIVTSAVCGQRVDELTMERDIYASKSSNWERMAGERDETIDQLQTEVDKLTAELNAQTDLTLTYAGAFSCTAYCAEEYAHICGEGHGITSSGAKVQPGVTVAADISILPYGTVVYIENVGLRVVQDTGSAVKGNKLDVCVNTHEEALSWSGYGSRRVWIISGGVEP